VNIISTATTIVLLLSLASPLEASETIQDVLSACPQASLGFSLENQAQALLSKDAVTSDDLTKSFALRGRSASIWRTCANSTTNPLLHDAAMVEALGNQALSAYDVATVSSALAGLKRIASSSQYPVVRDGASQFALKAAGLLKALESQH